MSDTIAAIATGGVISAIGIIRLSGDDAIAIASRVFQPKWSGQLTNTPDRKLVYGTLLDIDGNPIDLCLCTVSRGPNSYTGEDTAEFQCHGSPVVLSEGLRALFAAGARQAGPGEFTKRAFLNGRMDLSQAEAVIDLIDAETAAAAKNAVGQLAGALGKKAAAIYSNLLDIMAHFHAVIDYPDEDIDDFHLEEYTHTLDCAYDTLNCLYQTFDRGKILKDGVQSAIIGRPNTGKSSLLNALLGYERAIVTDIAGTTRDTIEEKLNLGGVLLRLTDTAGIHSTADTVEKLGVERSIAAAKNAELVIAMFDGSQPLTPEDQAVIDAAKDAPHVIAVVNKSDLPQRIELDILRSQFSDLCILSAAQGTGIDALATRAAAILNHNTTPAAAGEILTNARHADAVARAMTAIAHTRISITSGMTPDAVLTDVEAALAALGEITGQTVREDITSRIFERFCVGK
jgi:tRNA modification GTPase